MALYDTVANVVSETAVHCGLGTVSDVFASTDPSIVQMRGLLTSVGRRLILRHPWLQCLKEHTLTTDGSTSYTLPADFSTMVDQSGWDRTLDVQMVPVSRQDWQYYQAVDTDTNLLVVFKPKDLTIELLTASTGSTLAFEYRSRYWVAVTGSTTPTKDAPTLNTDVLCLDAELLKAALKYQFLKDKGFPSDAAYEDLKGVFNDVKGVNTNSAPVLSLGGCHGGGLINMSNAPLTGFGFDGSGGLL